MTIKIVKYISNTYKITSFILLMKGSFVKELSKMFQLRKTLKKLFS
jgi:hypothetical protein